MNRKRRHQDFSGFGLVRTKTYVTNRKPKIAFKKIKEIYGDELQRMSSNKKAKFSKDESEKVKSKVASIIKKQQREYYMKMVFIYSIILAIIIMSYFLSI